MENTTESIEIIMTTFRQMLQEYKAKSLLQKWALEKKEEYMAVSGGGNTEYIPIQTKYCPDCHNEHCTCDNLWQ